MVFLYCGFCLNENDPGRVVSLDRMGFLGLGLAKFLEDHQDFVYGDANVMTKFFDGDDLMVFFLFGFFDF